MSLAVISFHSLHHSLPFVVTRCITRLSFYKRSERYLFFAKYFPKYNSQLIITMKTYNRKIMCLWTLDSRLTQGRLVSLRECFRYCKRKSILLQQFSSTIKIVLYEQVYQYQWKYSNRSKRITMICFKG